jgi:hypothetical protein
MRRYAGSRHCSRTLQQDTTIDGMSLLVVGKRQRGCHDFLPRFLLEGNPVPAIGRKAGGNFK